MNILVTGARGMVGTALAENLKNIRDGKNRTRPDIHIDEIFCYDIDNNTPEELDDFCSRADFVFNLAA
jgi:UDP-2-acetamido-2,6-beta-L-arabino-hexul-4-ose reductase